MFPVVTHQKKGVLSQQKSILQLVKHPGKNRPTFSICMSSMRSKAEMNGACLKASSRQPGYCHRLFQGYMVYPTQPKRPVLLPFVEEENKTSIGQNQANTLTKNK